MIKLAIIGLDGGTFQVIKPLCDDNKLPNLNRMITQGTHGILESTFPPVTGPAWSAIATGKNPGKTGIFDSLIRINKESFETRLISSADIRRAKPYWDYLSEAGIKTAVVNYPFLYPPYKLNGIMVSGLGSDPGDEISYPREFKQLLLNKCGHYQIHLPRHGPKYVRTPTLLLDHLFRLLDVNDNTLQLLLESDLETLTFVISASDFAQHYMWRYFDPSHPYYREEEAKEYKDGFIQIWQKIDEILGSAMKKLPENTNVIIVSDHGFGCHRSDFYAGSWLEKEGYLHKRTSVNRVRKLQVIAAELVRRISPSLYNKLVKAATSGKMPTISATSRIDFARSLALPLTNASLVGEVCINRQAATFRSRAGDFEAIRQEVIEKLKETCRDLDVQVSVYLPNELYSGRYVDLAPDILFDIEDCECSVRFGFGKSIYQRPPSAPLQSGIHKKEGIFMAYGPDIKQGVETEGAKIYDVAPTILHILGLPVPDDMDGRVLMEIFREGSMPAQMKVEYQRADAERERVKDRIRKLRESARQYKLQ
jgi:predicted AlkP superfamily phosphohydrolase/phosphomutase